MKIRIEDITDDGLSLDVTEEPDGLAAVAGKLDFTIPAPAKAHLEITKTGPDVFVRGDINAAIGLTCGRCLKPFEQRISGDFNVFFALGAEKAREKELHAGDIDVNYIPGGELDTAEIILSQLSLEAPMQPLCSEGCKGLCPRCGADLNTDPCKCHIEEKPDPRFAKLKGFKLK